MNFDKLITSVISMQLKKQSVTSTHVAPFAPLWSLLLTGRLVLPVFEAHINGITQDPVFRVWLLGFTTMFVRLIHPVGYSYSVFIVTAV